MVSLALGEAGEVYSFGLNLDPDYSFGLKLHKQNTPLAIAALKGVRVCAMATGFGHSLFVSTAGRLYSFGLPCLRLALGHGLDRDQPFCLEMLKPRLVTALQDVRVLAVAAGMYHSLALSETGEVYSFGGYTLGTHDDFSPLGHGGDEGKLTPVVIPGLQGVHSVSAGGYTSFAVTNDGVVYGWGSGAGPFRAGAGLTGMPSLLPVLGLQLTETQCVPREYPMLQCLVPSPPLPSAPPRPPSEARRARTVCWSSELFELRYVETM